MSKVELIVNGKIYSGWKGVSVRRSMDLFASSFDLSLTDTQAGEARTIKLGSPCKVKVDGELVISGYVDRIRPGYDAKNRGLTVSGRSKVADLVDCSLPPQDTGSGQKNSQTLLQLAKVVAGRFGLKASSTVQGLEPIKRGVIALEQTAYEFLELHARTAGVRLVDDPEGNLVITEASKERVGTALVLGENIEAAEGEFSERDRFSKYHVFCQRSSFNTDLSGESYAHISGQASDLKSRYRPTTVNAEGISNLAEAKRRAEWQRNVAYGRSRAVTYTVNGWRYKAGWRHKAGLWRPNTIVLVKDEWMGFGGKGKWLMIGTVEYILDDGGELTRLTVMPREAYELIPLPSEEEDFSW